MKSNLTKNQKLVFNILQKSGHKLSAYAILDHLRPQGMNAPVQIYRALEALIEMQLVHKLESLNAFVICDHMACHDGDLTAFTICDDCGDVTELGAGDVAALLKQQVSENGFQISQTAIEIKGTCERCIQ